MKIVQLTAENVKKLKVVRIRPDGSLVVIGGKNGQGKSSVLECIMAALGGKKHVLPEAVREGEKKGYTELDLDNGISIKRTFTKDGGGQLTITNKEEGTSYSSPQAMLDKIVGKISFDPLMFARAGEKEQLEFLRHLTGLDFSELNVQRDHIYNERTEVNREIKSLEVRIEGIQVTKEKLEPVVVANLMKRLEEAQKNNHSIAEAKEKIEYFSGQITQTEKEIVELQKKIKNAEEVKKRYINERRELDKKIENEKPVDVLPIQKKINDAERINEELRRREEKKKLEKEWTAQKKKSNELTNKLEAIDENKRKAVEEARLPIKGLEFDESGVRFNGLPFSQASDAEQLRVSVALGIAANPKLKVLLVRNGSLLDEDNLKMVAAMAEKHGAQIWMERVGRGEEMSVIMEDGEVQ